MINNILDFITYNLKNVIITLIVTIVTIFVLLGFKTSTNKILYCSSNATIAMYAKFSNTDYEGNHDFWSDKVSDTYFVNMLDADILDQNIKAIRNNNIYVPDSNFDYDRSVRKDSDFDKFTIRRNIEIRAMFKNGKSVNIKNSEYPKCLSSINQLVLVKYWYVFPRYIKFTGESNSKIPL